MEFLRENFTLLLPIIILQLGLMIAGLVDLLRREQVTGGNKLIWALVIVFINIIGPIAYFAFGRKD
ncbi:MAG: PLDc_N domain-containing protein [Clostridia bacterium]|nr:PLDc_N domain-containing protein [Clostridia bacterium]